MFEYDKNDIIIIDGPDNTGKDTLISKLITNFKSATVYHCSKPIKGLTQDMYFSGITYRLCEKKNYFGTDVVIFNRFYQGEYVYGQIYRDESPVDIKEMINRLDKKFVDNFYINNDSVIYILLTVHNTEKSINMLVNNDDELSFSSNKDNQYDLIKKEVELFDEVYDLSAIKKVKIYVDDENGNFRSREDIYNDVINILKHDNVI